MSLVRVVLPMYWDAKTIMFFLLSILGYGTVQYGTIVLSFLRKAKLLHVGKVGCTKI